MVTRNLFASCVQLLKSMKFKSFSNTALSVYLQWYHTKSNQKKKKKCLVSFISSSQWKKKSREAGSSNSSLYKFFLFPSTSCTPQNNSEWCSWPRPVWRIRITDLRDRSSLREAFPFAWRIWYTWSHIFLLTTVSFRYMESTGYWRTTYQVSTIWHTALPQSGSNFSRNWVWLRGARSS